jgi:septal ring factor EnvC (AmiA/AmiB activator)
MNLKQMLDFKALANFFHVNPKQMETVKECREDFHSCFMKDSGNSILKLLEESKLIKNNTLEKIHELKEQIKDLEKSKKQVQKDPTEKMQTQIENIEKEIQEMETEKEKTLARQIKHEEAKQDLMDSLKNSLKGVNVELVD